MLYTITFEYVNVDGYPILPSIKSDFSKADTDDGPDVSQVMYWIRNRFSNPDLLFFTQSNVLLSVKCQTLRAICETYDYEPSDIVLFVRLPTPCETHHLLMLHVYKERIIQLDGMIKDSEAKESIALKNWKYFLNLCIQYAAHPEKHPITLGIDHPLYQRVVRAHDRYFFAEDMTNKFKEKMQEFWDEVDMIEEAYFDKTPDWFYNGKKRKI